MVRGLVLTILNFAAIAGILFVSAGRLDWPMGWAFPGVSIVIGTATLFAADPELINQRSQVRAGVDRSDMALAGSAFVSCVPLTLLVTGLDIGRFGWSPAYGLTVQVLALVVFTLGQAFACWALVTTSSFRHSSGFKRIAVTT